MEQGKHSGNDRKRLRQIVQIAGSLISLFLFFWLFRKQDWQAVWENMRQFPLWLWAVSFSLVAAGMMCNAWRWYVLLRAQKVHIPFGEVARIVFAGAFASNFLPSTIGGDAFRIVSLLRFTSDRVLSVASVVVDRVMNVAATFTFLPFAWIAFGDQLFEIFDRARLFPSLAGGVPVWEKLHIKFRDLFRKFVQTFAAWRYQPRALLSGFAISWLSIFVIYLSLWLLAHALGIPISLWQLAGIEFIVYVVTLLPVSLNGYGVREVLYTTLLMQMGATLDQAATLTLISRFLLVLATTPGVLWLSQILSFNAAHVPSARDS